MKEKEWLYVFELVKKLSYPVYGEDYEDTVSENLLYSVQTIIAERKGPGRPKKITAELVLKKILNRLRTRKAKYRRKRNYAY